MKYLQFYAIIGILIAAVCFLGFKLISKDNQINKLEKAEDNIKQEIQIEAERIKTKVDEKGIETVIFDVTKNIIPAEILAKGNLKTEGIIDTTAMALDIRTEQLNSITQIAAVLSAKNLKLEKTIDSLNHKFYTYNKGGLKLKFTPPTNIDSSSYADIDGEFSVTATRYWKNKTWLSRNKKELLAVTSDNPIIKVSNVNYVGFTKKNNHSLIIQARSLYSISSNKTFLGGGVEYKYKNTALIGYGYYDTKDNRFRPTVGLSLDLIKF